MGIHEDNRDAHLNYLKVALEEAKKCEPVKTAFCVGCVIVTHWPDIHSSPVVLSTGFSRELPGNTHAEANALAKFRALTDEELRAVLGGVDSLPTPEDLLRHADVYSTMEPCSIRTSGLAPCADALIASNIHRCFIGVEEPKDFVICEGTRKLREAGIEVTYVRGLETECLAEARRGH